MRDRGQQVCDHPMEYTFVESSQKSTIPYWTINKYLTCRTCMHVLMQCNNIIVIYNQGGSACMMLKFVFLIFSPEPPSGVCAVSNADCPDWGTLIVSVMLGVPLHEATTLWNSNQPLSLYIVYVVYYYC